MSDDTSNADDLTVDDNDVADTSSTATESAALAIKNGCDLNCGNVYLQMLLAYKEGLVTEEDISNSYESVIHRLIAEKEKTGVNIPNAKKKRRRSKVGLSGYRNNRVVRTKR